MKRFVVDWAANYVFFVPLVILFNGYTWHWSPAVIVPYALTSIIFSALSGRLFVIFLNRIWYPVCKESF